MDVKYKVGDKVAVFSRTEGKWFDDGVVAQSAPSGTLEVHYHYSNGGMKIKEVSDHSKLLRRRDFYNEPELRLFVRHMLSEDDGKEYTPTEFRTSVLHFAREYKSSILGVFEEEEIVDQWMVKLYKEIDGSVTFKHFQSTFPYDLNFTVFTQFISNFVDVKKIKQICETNKLSTRKLSESEIHEFVHYLICLYESQVNRCVYLPRRSETHYWVQLLGGRLWRELRVKDHVPMESLCTLQNVVRVNYLDLRRTGTAPPPTPPMRDKSRMHMPRFPAPPPSELDESEKLRFQKIAAITSNRSRFIQTPPKRFPAPPPISPSPDPERNLVRNVISSHTISTHSVLDFEPNEIPTLEKQESRFVPDPHLRFPTPPPRTPSPDEPPDTPMWAANSFNFDVTSNNAVVNLATQGLKHYGEWNEELDQDIKGMFFLTDPQLAKLRKFMEEKQAKVMPPSRPVERPKIVQKDPKPAKRKRPFSQPTSNITMKKHKKNTINLDNTYWKIHAGRVAHVSKISFGIYEVTLAQTFEQWARLIFEGDTVNLIEHTETLKGTLVSSRRIRWESGEEWEMTPSFFIGIWEQEMEDDSSIRSTIRYEIRANLRGEDMFEVYDIFGVAWASCMLLRSGQVQLTTKKDQTQIKGRIKYKEVSSKRKVVDRIEWEDGDLWTKFYYRLNWKKFFLFLYRFAKSKEASRTFWYSNVGTTPNSTGKLFELMHLLIVHFETDQEARIVPNWYLTKNYCCEICHDILNDLDLTNDLTINGFDQVLTWCRNRGRPRPIMTTQSAPQSTNHSRESSGDSASSRPIIKRSDTAPSLNLVSQNAMDFLKPRMRTPYKRSPANSLTSNLSLLRQRSLSSVTITPSPPTPNLYGSGMRGLASKSPKRTPLHIPPKLIPIAQHKRIAALRDDDDTKSMASIIELGEPESRDWRSQWQAGSKIEIYFRDSWVESVIHKITTDDAGEWIHIIQEGKHLQLRRYDSTIRCRQKPNLALGGIYRWPKHDKQVPLAKDDWKDGSLVEVYSRSKEKWLIGSIQAIFKNYLLDVSYYDPSTHHSAFKQIQRDHPNIRPLKNQGSYRMCILCDIIVQQSEWAQHLASTMHEKCITVIPSHFKHGAGKKVYFSTVAFQEQNLMYFNQIKACFQNKTFSHIILSYLKTMVGTDVDVYHRNKWCGGVIVDEHNERVKVLLFDFPYERFEFNLHSKNIHTSGIHCPRLPFLPQFETLDVLEDTRKYMNNCWYNLCSLRVDENLYGRSLLFVWCAMGD